MANATLADLTDGPIGLPEGGDLEDDPGDYEVVRRWETAQGWAAVVVGPSGQSDLVLNDLTGTTIYRDRGEDEEEAEEDPRHWYVDTLGGYRDRRSGSRIVLYVATSDRPGNDVEYHWLNDPDAESDFAARNNLLGLEGGLGVMGTWTWKGVGHAVDDRGVPITRLSAYVPIDPDYYAKAMASRRESGR